MDNETEKKLLDLVMIEGNGSGRIALEIIHPENGFLSYLLRCGKVNPNELGENTIIIKDLMDSDYKFEPLDNDIKNRIKKRKELSEHYRGSNPKLICVNLEISDYDTFIDIYDDITDDEFVEFSKTLIQYVLDMFPTFDEDLAVWHMEQLDIKDESLIRRIHMHLMLRKKFRKNISDKEKKLIFNNNY